MRIIDGVGVQAGLKRTASIDERSSGVGAADGVGTTLSVGLGSALGPVEAGAWLTSGVGDGVDCAAPPRIPEMTAPIPMAITPSATKATTASGPTRPERCSGSWSYSDAWYCPGYGSAAGKSLPNVGKMTLVEPPAAGTMPTEAGCADHESR